MPPAQPSGAPTGEEALFGELFNAAMSENAQQELESVMKQYMSSNPDLQQQFETLLNMVDTPAGRLMSSLLLHSVYLLVVRHHVKFTGRVRTVLLL